MEASWILINRSCIQCKEKNICEELFQMQPYLGWAFLKIWRGAGWASKLAVKKHAVSQKLFVHFTWNFVHVLYWQHGISLDKKINKCHFIWWRRYESHGLISCVKFRIEKKTKILTGSTKYTENRWPKIILKS